MPESKSSQPFLIQIYFVAATLIGLVLIIIAGVTLSQMALNEVLGVHQYPSFSAPYPPYKDSRTITSTDEGLTVEQQESLEEWQQQYERFQQSERAYNNEDQSRRRKIAESLGLLIIGIPVFALHAPYVFRKKNS